MSFLFPNTANITRVQNVFNTQDGLHSEEVPVVYNLPCTIQLKRDMGFQVPHAFPASSNTDSPQPLWVMVCRTSNGLIEKMDKVTNENGMQFQIEAVYWSPLMTSIEMREYKP